MMFLRNSLLFKTFRNYEYLYTAPNLSRKEIYAALNSINSQLSSAYKFVNNLISLFRTENLQDYIRETDEALLFAKNEEEYYEVLVKRVPFLPLQKNDQIASSVVLQIPAYRVHTIIDDIHGMKAIFLVPDVIGESQPLLLFRGTDGSNIRNLLDDLGGNPGTLNFARQKENIQKTLEEISVGEGYGAFHVLGYSFGGALAQKTTAEFPEYISRCTSHNGLQAGAITAKIFHEKMKQYPESYPKPEIWEYRHAKDIVPQLGKKSLPTNEGKLFVYGGTDEAVNSVQAHTILMLKRYNEKPIHEKPVESYTTLAVETVRQYLGDFLIPVYKMTKYFV